MTQTINTEATTSNQQPAARGKLQQQRSNKNKRNQQQRQTPTQNIDTRHQVISVAELFQSCASTTPAKATPMPTTPRIKNQTPPAHAKRRDTQRSPTSTNFATPAYADSPKACELPPPPAAWLTPKSAHPTATPRRHHHHMNHVAPMQANAASSSSPKFTGLDLIRKVALAAQ